jgi:hypothetical protein
MHRPPITRLELEAVLRREVKHYVALGVKKADAIKQVATEQGIDPEWVEDLTDGSPGGEA